MSLYPYQQLAVDEIRFHYKQLTKKVLLHLATGGGKTHIFSHIIKATAERGNKCIMVVRGRELVKQASRRLDNEGVDHGVMMSNHWRNRPKLPVQICSIDTLARRKIVPDADLVVIDEAHMATSSGYYWLAQEMKDAFFLAVTATPYCKKSLTHVAEKIVHPITIKELIDQGFLVPCRHYAPNAPDMKGVRTKNGDYDLDDLETKMNVLTGDIVNHYKEHGEGRAAICFAVNVRHSHYILNQFNSAGIVCEHMDANTDDSEREAIFGRLKSGATRVVTNVGILGTGVDLPFVSCIIMARPTKSYNLYIQQAGRGTRTFPGKTDFILLDHAGNASRHGLITEEQDVDLEGKHIGKKPKTCKVCFLVYATSFCPCCGPQEANTQDREIKEIAHADGNLVEITDAPIEVQVKRFVDGLKKIQKAKGYKRGWIYYKVKDKFGEEIADIHFPKRELPWFIKAKLEKEKMGQ